MVFIWRLIKRLWYTLLCYPRSQLPCIHDKQPTTSAQASAHSFHLNIIVYTSAMPSFPCHSPYNYIHIWPILFCFYFGVPFSKLRNDHFSDAVKSLIDLFLSIAMQINKLWVRFSHLLDKFLSGDFTKFIDFTIIFAVNNMKVTKQVFRVIFDSFCWLFLF